MRLSPMLPSPYTSGGNMIYVFCSRCNAKKSGENVSCDLDAKPFTYYCQDCVTWAVLEAESRGEECEWLQGVIE